MDASSQRKRTPLQVLLGIFILWQLCFLLSSNFAFLLGKSKTHDIVDDVNAHWEQVTGMWQGWAQFTGNIVRQAVYPVFELRWEGGHSVRITACAAVEPEDPEHFLRLPVHARL